MSSALRTLTLTEYQTVPAVALSLEERDALQWLVPGLAISPTPGSDAAYDLTAGSWIGALSLGALAIEIRPKLPISSVLFLLSYALDPRSWRDTPFDYRAGSLVEAIIPAFAQQVRRATRHGLLHGYRAQEEALPGLRGRLRFDEQLRRHAGCFPPVEVRYDDFTADVDENRLLKAAIHAMQRLPLRSPAAARLLRQAAAPFTDVQPASYPPHAVPQVRYTPRNAHYRPAVELARLILRAAAFDLGHGAVPAAAFLVDMNQAFEDFVVVALREALGLSERAFPQGLGWSGMGAPPGRRPVRRLLSLDRAGAVRLQPDLSWWDGAGCTFVGDVKYKRSGTGGVEHPDLYQLLAYVVAAGLPGGLLVYAAGAGGDDAPEVPVSHEVVRAGKQLQVTSLDLARPPEHLLSQVEVLSRRVRRLRDGSLRAA